MDSLLSSKLMSLAEALLDQKAATVLIEPQRRSSGFWFGGGNMIRLDDGSYVVVGRYRNFGDSRTGLAAGERGLELAVFQGSSPTGPMEKVLSFDKPSVRSGEAEVLSIEGASLYQGDFGLELFISSEKQAAYPAGLEAFQKPGTGVWSIDAVRADTLAGLGKGDIFPMLGSEDPQTLHVKDPVAFRTPNGNTAMIYCTHPYTWTSSNSGLAIRESGERWFYKFSDSVLARGFVWDVACTRVTDRLPVPSLGVLADHPPVALYFYDGAECVRQLEENTKAVKRPRGYSCEEIGGLAAGYDESFPDLERLSIDKAAFISPWGTGCSRYVSTLVTDDAIIATWQQSQADGSQPLVVNVLPMDKVEAILKAE